MKRLFGILAVLALTAGLLFLCCGSAGSEKLAAPANVNVTQTERFHLRLTWDAVSGAKEYQIQLLIYETRDPFWAVEGNTELTSYDFTIGETTDPEAINASRDNLFRIAAVDENGELGAFSDIVFGETGSYHWREIETEFVSENGGGENRITMNFRGYTAGRDYTGQPFVTFEFYRSEAGKAMQLIQSIPADECFQSGMGQFSLVCHDKNIRSGTEYRYQVNVLLSGEVIYPENPELRPTIEIYNPIASFRPLPSEIYTVNVPEKSAAPKVKAEMEESDGIPILRLSWDAADGADRYYVHFGSVDSKPETPEELIGRVGSCQVAGPEFLYADAEQEGIFAYTVTPSQSGTNDRWFSNSRIGYAAMYRVPYSIRTVTEGSADLTWDCFTKLKGARYRIERKEEGSEWTVVGTSTEKQFTDAAAETGKTYLYRVSVETEDEAFGVMTGLPSETAAITISSGPAQETRTVVGEATYELSPGDGTAAYLGPVKGKKIKKATVPKTIRVGNNSYRVTKIAANAFSGCGNLKKVTIGKYVTEIGEGAFRKCVALEKITIPANVEKIGANAFSGCIRLVKIILKTRKLTARTVGKNAFKGNEHAVIKCPKGLTKSYRKILRKKGGKKATYQ